MDQQTIDKLMKLKELYEAGILTKEEVEEEKKKILNTQQDEPVGEQLPELSSETQENKSDVVVEEDATPIMRHDESGFAFKQPKVKPQPETTNGTTPSSQTNNRAALLGVFILIVISLIFIIIAVKCNGSDNNDYDDQTYPEVIDEVEDSAVYVEDSAFAEDEYETITSTDDDEFANDLCQEQQSYMSYDWAFFELKGRVKSVIIVYDENYEEVHEFSSSGILLNEDAETIDGYNPFGYNRDDSGRIVGTGNGHTSWTWKESTIVKMEFAHQGSESTAVYTYDAKGNRTGYKDENGEFHKYAYITHDHYGNWTYRIVDDYSEKRKIEYY